MKKTMLIMATLVTALTLAKGMTTVGAGVNMMVEPVNYDNPRIYTGFNLDARHLVPVYEINSKTSILAGGGANVKFNFLGIKGVAEKTVDTQIDITGYGTAQLKYSIKPELSIRTGLNAGLGLGMNIILPHNNKPTYMTAIPIDAVLGLDYKNFSADLKLGTALHPKFSNAKFNMGLNLGYSF